MPQKPIICTVDVVLLCLQGGVLQVALLQRDKPPFAGGYALPGGYIHPEQDADALDAAVRMLSEKTGLSCPYLEQLGTFSGAARDPRGWSISIVYYALVLAELIWPDRTPGLQLQPVNQLKTLPFDHKEIVLAAVDRVRNKSSYSSLPVYLCGEKFTLPRLQAVCEAILAACRTLSSGAVRIDTLRHRHLPENRDVELHHVRSQVRLVAAAFG